MVLAVNMVSPNINQVSTGNIISPAEDAINLAVHAESVASTMNFQPYQNETEVGTPNNTADNRALSFQYSEKDCKFS